jgi:hypothetical protein
MIDVARKQPGESREFIAKDGLELLGLKKTGSSELVSLHGPSALAQY